MNALAPSIEDSERLSLIAPERRSFVQKAMTKIAHLANRDTPESVVIPPNLAGIMTYAAARLGVGALFAYGCYFLHTDNERLHERYETHLQQQVESQSKIIESMQSMVKVMSAAMEIVKSK